MLKTLVAYRKAKGMTQTELGQRVGVSQRAIAAYEAGERRPSVKVMNRLIAELGMPLEQAWEIMNDSAEVVQ